MIEDRHARQRRVGVRRTGMSGRDGQGSGGHGGQDRGGQRRTVKDRGVGYDLECATIAAPVHGFDDHRGPRFQLTSGRPVCTCGTCMQRGALGRVDLKTTWEGLVSAGWCLSRECWLVSVKRVLALRPHSRPESGSWTDSTVSGTAALALSD